MYVCICNAYRERDILEAARRGARTAEEAYRVLGEGPCCGHCLPTAQSLIEDLIEGLMPAGCPALMPAE